MITQEHEIHAWLGEDWTDEQITQITAEYLRLQPLTDDDEEQAELLAAVAQRVDGTLDLSGLAQSHLRARLEAATATDLLRAAVRVHVAAGMTETEAARISGVGRMTVRVWMGKR